MRRLNKNPLLLCALWSALQTLGFAWDAPMGDHVDPDPAQAAMEAIEQRILKTAFPPLILSEEALPDLQVMVFGAKWCPTCRSLEKALDQNGVLNSITLQTDLSGISARIPLSHHDIDDFREETLIRKTLAQLRKDPNSLKIPLIVIQAGTEKFQITTEQLFQLKSTLQQKSLFERVNLAALKHVEERTIRLRHELIKESKNPYIVEQRETSLQETIQEQQIQNAQREAQEQALQEENYVTELNRQELLAKNSDSDFNEGAIDPTRSLVAENRSLMIQDCADRSLFRLKQDPQSFLKKSPKQNSIGRYSPALLIREFLTAGDSQLIQEKKWGRYANRVIRGACSLEFSSAHSVLDTASIPKEYKNIEFGQFAAHSSSFFSFGAVEYDYILKMEGDLKLSCHDSVRNEKPTWAAFERLSADIPAGALFFNQRELYLQALHSCY